MMIRDSNSKEKVVMERSVKLVKQNLHEILLSVLFVDLAFLNFKIIQT